MNLSIGHRTPRAYGGRELVELERGGAHVGAAMTPEELDALNLDRSADLERCPTCQNYAWDRSVHTPAIVGGVVHHPACAFASSANVAGCSSCSSSSWAAYKKAKAARAAVGGLFGPDIKASGDELVTVLQQSVNQLSVDIAHDACGDAYGPECKGTSPAVDELEKKLADAEAKGDTLDAASVLTAAGVEPTTANVAAFAACVKKREDSTAAVPRGTLAYCAIAVRDQTSKSAPLLPKSHTSLAFRDNYATFVASFERFVSQWDTETSSALGDPKSLEPALAKQLSQYNSYRNQFIDFGGETTAPSIGEPLGWPATIAIGAAVAGGLYLLAQLLLRKYVG